MMLARAARRKLRRDAFRSPTQLAEQLTLPWLCPSQMRWAATGGPSLADSRKPRTNSLLSLSSRLDTRSLATAADVLPSSMSPSFNNLMTPLWDVQAQSSSRLEPWDPSKPLVIPNATVSPSIPKRFGIGGDPTELWQNLYACLRVGRMDRATAIVERLKRLFNPSVPEVVEAHNLFLQTMFEMAEQNPTPESMEEMEEWYNKHVLGDGIEPNADTFVTMLRASMTFLEGQAMTASVQKYLKMAQDSGADVVDDINNSEEFTDAEWNTVIRNQPEKFMAPSLAEGPEDIQISTPLGHAKLVEAGVLPNPAHHIEAHAQKGLGLASLKASLAMFESNDTVPYPHDMVGTKEEMDRAHAYLRQLQIESDATGAAVRRWEAEDKKLQDIGIHGVVKSKPIQALMWQWYSSILPAIKKEVAKCKQVLSNPTTENLLDQRHMYGAYLEACSPETLAALTVSCAIQACARGNRDGQDELKVSVMTRQIADQIQNEINMKAQKKHKSLVRKARKTARREMLSKLSLTASSAESKPKSRSLEALTTEPVVDKFAMPTFPTAIKMRIGAIMIEALLQTARITVSAHDPKTGKEITSTQPAFHHHVGFINGKRIGFISPHAEIWSKIRSESVHSISTSLLPMVFEPNPWTKFDDGGFYTQKATVIRIKGIDAAQRAYAHSAISNGDMDKVLTGLNVLGRVPWQINKGVFEVMAQVWNSGEALGGLVASKFDQEPPVEPSQDASPIERNRWLKSMQQWENAKSGLHSQRCFQNFQLEIARAYLKEKKIYFPHSVDFRGRAYPIPPLLNHIGADFARGLLQFANGKELGAVGLQWIKIQLANLYGFDKASLREREQFAMDHLSEVYDSATNPLDGRRWWAKAEDPWQCLACCMELKNALDSPDPTRYVSRLPVHQDGTCNGLQHYAALGGDHAGASQVNLEPSDRPQDIYTGVADLVRAMVEEDAANDNALALFVKDKITRKVVKRTVMTNVYGVTFIGAKNQVAEELKDIFPNFQPTPEIPHINKVALYIALKIFSALGKIFNGAQEIQYWLGECGDRITTSISPEQIRGIRNHLQGVEPQYSSKYKRGIARGKAIKQLKQDNETFKTSIIWTTPLKMPVVQPYRKDRISAIRTSLQDVSIKHQKSYNEVDKRKQLQAFPPNFIHSLDATHMLLSAIKCGEMGLDFAAVHDSFWTHAADIATLNVILRDAFVRMHSEDIMGRLAAEFKARYAGSMYRANLLIASDVGKKIIAWRRERRGSKSKTAGLSSKHKEASFEEVALEQERQELLNSEDPEQRAKGEKMVTPTSIWLANPDPSAMASYRLALLGETKKQGDNKFDQVKEKILGAEVETSSDLRVADLHEDVPVEDVDVMEADVEDVKEDEEEEAAEEASNAKTAKPRPVPSYATMHVWLPISFPPVPKKGSWDVARLKESKYFFS